MKLTHCFAISVLATAISAQAQEAAITVDAVPAGHAISPMVWGIFFEDINLSADGGIYPELVRNRSFEDAEKLEHWQFASLADRARRRSSGRTTTPNPAAESPQP